MSDGLATKTAAQLAREKLKLPLGSRPVISTRFSSAQVIERPGATGYEVVFGGHFEAIQPRMPGEPPEKDNPDGLEFFPTAGITGYLTLQWSTTPGTPKPGAAFFGTTVDVTIEGLNVPVEPVRDPLTWEVVGAQRADRDNGALHRPITERRR